MEHGETSTVFVVARSAKRNNHDPHDLLVGFRRVDDIFFRYDGMSANATGMIWRTLLVALARVGNVILTSFTFGENTNILRGTVKLRCRWAVAEIKCSLLLAMISFTFLSGSNETIPTHRHV